MKAYSLDLRERVVAAYQNGVETIREIAEQFQVSESFIKKMLVRHRGSGGGQQKKLSEAHRKWLLKTVLATPDITLSELESRLSDKKKILVSVPTLSRELRRLNLRRKKNQWLLVSKMRENEPRIGVE